jgi:hypothetical protein
MARNTEASLCAFATRADHDSEEIRLCTIINSGSVGVNTPYVDHELGLR